MPSKIRRVEFVINEKPLKWLGFVVVLSHRCGIKSAPMGYELWEFQNRFNDLIVIQFHIIKPM
jgi:hypothetical protein